jgi:1,4-alpha-glucan branching enzyme
MKKTRKLKGKLADSPAAATPASITKKSTPETRSVAIQPETKASPTAGSRVSLEFVKPDARQVFVAGSFNQWKPESTPLVRAADGRWTGEVAVKPGRYEYLFVVDGNWLPDPKAMEAVQNPFGGTNSVMQVSE